MSTLLALRDVVAGYGPVTVLNGATLAIRQADRFALLGRNGAGKSTLLKTVLGLADVQAGSVVFDGDDISRASTQARAHLGIGYVPQTRDVFSSLTVEENLIAGLKRRPRTALEEAYSLFPRLKDRRRHRGSHLSGGEQQMLSIARAMLGKPRLLLLDEPLEGLAPLICQELLHVLQRMATELNIAVVIVEQQVYEVLDFAQQAAILAGGQVQYTGTTHELRVRQDILDRHVGVGAL